jgi:hypothetical protein
MTLISPTSPPMSSGLIVVGLEVGVSVFFSVVNEGTEE